MASACSPLLNISLAMDFIEHQIKVSKTAHYYTNSNDVKSCKYLWIMCHGYGMLAENLLGKMEWANEDHFLISIEGLSKFYWEGVTGRPVASWMTKKNRLDEIEDYSNYLSLVYKKYYSQIPADAKVILFGFSQGGTTIWRWLQRENIEFDLFINYAGWVPEDIKFSPEQKMIFNQKKLIQLYGNKDKYLNDERKMQLHKIIEMHEFKIAIHEFNGEHKMYAGVIENNFNKYI